MRVTLPATIAVVLAGCDGVYFRRIDITGSDNVSIAIDGQSTRAVIAALREYAEHDHLSCPETPQWPFECTRTPVHVWAQSSQGGLTVCYRAMGTEFERRKFERRIQQLQATLVSHFTADSVRSVGEMCPQAITTRADRESLAGTDHALY